MRNVLYDITTLSAVRADNTVFISGLDPLAYASILAKNEAALCVCI